MTIHADRNPEDDALNQALKKLDDWLTENKGADNWQQLSDYMSAVGDLRLQTKKFFKKIHAAYPDLNKDFFGADLSGQAPDKLDSLKAQNEALLAIEKNIQNFELSFVRGSGDFSGSAPEVLNVRTSYRGDPTIQAWKDASESIDYKLEHPSDIIDAASDSSTELERMTRNFLRQLREQEKYGRDKRSAVVDEMIEETNKLLEIIEPKETEGQISPEIDPVSAQADETATDIPGMTDSELIDELGDTLNDELNLDLTPPHTDDTADTKPRTSLFSKLRQNMRQRREIRADKKLSQKIEQWKYFSEAWRHDVKHFMAQINAAHLLQDNYKNFSVSEPQSLKKDQAILLKRLMQIHQTGELLNKSPNLTDDTASSLNDFYESLIQDVDVNEWAAHKTKISERLNEAIIANKLQDIQDKKARKVQKNQSDEAEIEIKTVIKEDYKKLRDREDLSVQQRRFLAEMEKYLKTRVEDTPRNHHLLKELTSAYNAKVGWQNHGVSDQTIAHKKLYLNQQGHGKSDVALKQNKNTITGTFIGNRKTFGPKDAHLLAKMVVLATPGAASAQITGSIEGQYFLKMALEYENKFRAADDQISTMHYNADVLTKLSAEERTLLEERWKLHEEALPKPVARETMIEPAAVPSRAEMEKATASPPPAPPRTIKKTPAPRAPDLSGTENAARQRPFSRGDNKYGTSMNFNIPGATHPFSYSASPPRDLNTVSPKTPAKKPEVEPAAPMPSSPVATKEHAEAGRKEPKKPASVTRSTPKISKPKSDLPKGVTEQIITRVQNFIKIAKGPTPIENLCEEFGMTMAMAKKVANVLEKRGDAEGLIRPASP